MKDIAFIFSRQVRFWLFCFCFGRYLGSDMSSDTQPKGEEGFYSNITALRLDYVHRLVTHGFFFKRCFPYCFVYVCTANSLSVNRISHRQYHFSLQVFVLFTLPHRLLFAFLFWSAFGKKFESVFPGY